MKDKRTCADCEYHKCTTTCKNKDTKHLACNGICDLQNGKMRCSKSICSNFKQYIWG